MSEIGNNIVEMFSVNLSKINNSMSDFIMSDNWLDKITASTKTMLNSAQGGINNIINQRRQNDSGDKIYKVITTVLAVTTSVLTPIIEIVIIFLPNLLSGIFSNIQKQKQETQIRNTILTQIIPSMKKELRAKLPEIFNQQVQEIIVNISSQFEGAIQEKQDTITTTQRDIESKIANIEQTIVEYKDVNAKILVLANQTLFI